MHYASEFSPLKELNHLGNPSYFSLGEELIALGKVGCIILEGGQGSRLNSSIPKALIPIPTVEKKTLLQIFFEMTAAATKKMQRALPLAVMTSPLNCESLAAYLEENDFFGLDKSAIALFQQQMLPFLDDRENPIVDASGSYAQGPDGNGGALKAFYEAGIFEEWRKRGVEYLLTVLIDNPLADPFDPELCGFHASSQADASLKGVQRLSIEEKVGLIVQRNGKPRL